MHAALITAYKDFPMLHRLVRRLHAGGVKCFVHIDRKAAYSQLEIAALAPFAAVLPKRHAIYWGSYSHLQAIIDLMVWALEDQTICFLHTISGQDFPVRSMMDLNPENIYMEFIPYQDDNEMVRDRIHYRKLFYRMEGVRWLYRPLNKAAFHAQKVMRVRRTMRSYKQIYKGLVWMSLPADACRFVVQSPEGKLWLQQLRNVYVPEEFFFQTILMHSEFRNRVVNNNMRFMLWSRRYGQVPAVLDETDVEAIRASGALFARKLDSRFSEGLLTKLEGDAEY